MSEMSYLWTAPSEAGDGAASYTRADWARIAEILAACSGSEGVAPGYLNELEVTQAGANAVEVNTGGAVVDGKPYLNSAVKEVNIPSAVGSGNTRIDLIVLRADWTAQTVRITVIEGTDAANPSAPEPTNDSGNVKDVVLGEVLVNTSGTIIISPTIQWAVLQADNVTIENAGSTIQVKDSGITTEKIDDDAVDDTKVGDRVPQVYRRQGNSASNWSVSGNTSFTPGAVRMQLGSGTVIFPAEDNIAELEVTFPVEFSNPPLVFATLINPTHGSAVWITQIGAAKDGFVIELMRAGPLNMPAGINVNWLAIGPE